MERIKQIWEKLEEQSSSVSGFFKIRYSDSSKCDLFLGMKSPESTRIFIIRAPLERGKEFNFRYEFRGLKFEKIYDPDDNKYLLLNLVLADIQFKDVFDTLIEDILTAVIDETETNIILKNYSNRLIKWQSLFERFKQQGLNPEEQRGLFGELYFIRKFMKVNPDFTNIILSWLGSEKQIRDFQFGKWSVEVKTTQGNNHQRIHVSSERQLDTTNLDDLFLYHISLESRQQSGESLNDIVENLSSLLINDLLALNQFRNKLIEAGFFDIHRQYYSEIGYFVRQDIFYKVENSFPRIEEKDIRDGVGDVKYSIVVSQCSDFNVTEENTFKKLTFI